MNNLRRATRSIGKKSLRPAMHITWVVVVWIGLCCIDWSFGHPITLLGYAYFVLAVLAYLPFSFLFVTFCYHFISDEYSVPRVWKLDENPQVAVLYTTYNDVMPCALEETQQAIEYPADLWILSDSDDPDAVAIEESFGWWTRFTRTTSRGGKGGILNDWMDMYGDDYEYIITLDADSILTTGNVTQLVEHAEHPSNSHIGVFQSLMKVSPTLATTRFSQIIGRGVQWSTRFQPLVMRAIYGQNSYWGSNALLRIDAIRESGGFEEELLCEDFILSTRLDRHGWTTLVIDAYSYEGFPLDLYALRTRTLRWVRANREMVSLLFSNDVSLGTRVNCCTPLAFYAVAPFYWHW